jgi:ferrous iron transporter FeoB
MGIKIALAGNPNCGKTTMFNDLTGSSQYVGNWPGVTVEKKEGKLRGHHDVIITDLPGIYSLSPYTLEEVVTRNYLMEDHPDAIINLVDATNLERNLYLTTQIMELGIPVVIALNMMDIVNKNGDIINIQKLSAALGCEIIETTALKGQGSQEVAEKAIALAEKKGITAPKHQFAKSVEGALSEIEKLIRETVEKKHLRWYCVKLFERDVKVMAEIHLSESARTQIEKIITTVEKGFEDDCESIITNERYVLITEMVKNCVQKKERGLSTSDKIDQIVTNRILALPIFAVVMFLLYFISVSWLGTIVTQFANETFFGKWIQPAVATFLTSIGSSPWLISLIVDGIIGGVGAVLGFVPQMLILFLFLSLLEDCGYMARVAFIMDRIFRKFGLSGKSFIPLLISSGCGVPGIMATKTIENEKDRRMTIITATFIPCGAKLPVIALIGGSMFPGSVWIAPVMYFFGIAAVILSGFILKKTKLFAGNLTPFVMELPPYHIPSAKNVLFHTWERGKAFIIKAGTVIFIACGIIWFLSNFGFSNGSFGMIKEETGSILAKIGTFIAPFFAPLGFGSWQATVATITGLVAKENVVGTLGVLYKTKSNSGLFQQIALLFPYGPAALSFLMFNMFCIPCVAAVGAIKREMASAKWTCFALGYQITFAYVVSLLVNQIGGLLAGALPFSTATVAAFLVFAFVLYLLFRPTPGTKTKIAKKVTA